MDTASAKDEELIREELVREELTGDADEIRELAVRARLDPPCLEPSVDEAALEAAAQDLRRRWLHRAHRPADSTLKSPCAGTEARMPGGDRVWFGYERELDPANLERREPLDFPVPPGWSSARLLLRSGQAALSCLLQLVAGLHAHSTPLRVHHAGRYFETASLLGLLPLQMLRVVRSDVAEVDLVIGEPIFCDGSFGITDPACLPRATQALLLDTTLSATATDLAPWLERAQAPLVAVFRSGLKLDQAGLELANVGIVQLFVREQESLDRIVERLRRLRSLTGSGLTLDEMAALSAPWFLDHSYLGRYSGRIFAHNAALARAVGPDSAIFESECHPSLLQARHSASPVAPFCVFRLRSGDLAAHKSVLARLEREANRRGLVVARGGSFGFRGTRYELIEPPPAEGAPFLRIAMGARGGPTTAGMIELLWEIATGR